MLDTYAMVVWCLTVFMFLIIILSNNWTNKKVDYTNVFTQTELKEEVYIDPPPRGFGQKDDKYIFLTLNTSLYALGY